MIDRLPAQAPALCMLVRTGVWGNPRVVKQAASLVDAGWRVTVVSMGAPGEDQRMEDHPAGFRILRTRPGWRARRRARRVADDADPSAVAAGPYKPGRLRLGFLLLGRVWILLQMLPLIRRARPDVVLAHNVNTLLTAWLGARLNGARLAYDAHEVNLDREGYYRSLRPVIRMIEGCVLPRCDLVMTTTDMRARHFRRVYRLATAPRVFQNRPPYHVLAKPVSLREKLGIGADAVVALYQGGLQEGRGLHNMIRAVAQVEGLALVFLGDGAQRASLEALAESLAVRERVFFPGTVSLDDLPAWTAGADMGLQLLRNTCFNHYSTDSNKLFEYALAGLPVIASDFPEIRRIVKAHGFGLLVDPHDVAAIADAMHRLVDEAGLRSSLAEAADRAAPSLSWEAVEAEYVAAMTALVDRA